MVQRRQAVEQLGFARGFVEFLVAEEGFLEAEVLEKKPGAAGILGGDQIGSGEGFAGAGGEIGKVADGGSDDEKTAGIHGG